MEGLCEEVTLPRRKGDRTCENLGKAHQDWVSAGGSCWFLPFRLLCRWDNKHSAQHRGDWHSTEGTGWINPHILDWTVDQKRNVWEMMHGISLESGEWFGWMLISWFS